MVRGAFQNVNVAGFGLDTVPRMRPATAIVILVLLVVIVIAGAFQLRAILTG